MLKSKPTGFGRISNLDLPVAFLDEFDRIVQTLGRFRRILSVKRFRNAIKMIQDFKIVLIVPFVSSISKFEFALDFELFGDR